MHGDKVAESPRRPRRRAGLRVRLTAIAVAIVTVPLVGGALLLGQQLHAALVDTLRQQTVSRLTTIALAVEVAGPGSVVEFARDDALRDIVIVDSTGQLVAASDAAQADSIPAPLPPGQLTVTDSGGAWVPFVGAPSTVTASAGVVVAGLPFTVAITATTDEVDATVDQFTGYLLAAVPLALVAVGWATWLAVGRTLGRVDRIRSRVAEIAEAPRSLGARVEVPPERDEIADLAGTMNDMLAAIERSRATERRFVADAGHELRSPLASVTAAVELAGDDVDEWRAVRPIVDIELERLRRLVDDLVTLGRLDGGPANLRASSIDVTDVVAGHVDRVRLAAPVLDVDARLQTAPVVADPEAISTIVRNLLDNATRHARQRVRVEAGPLPSGAGAVVVVADDGPGVPEAERERIFERFVRLDESRTRDTGGAGLGLAITRGLVVAHGGSVDVDRDAALGGAAFTVRLPTAPAPEAVSAAAGQPRVPGGVGSPDGASAAGSTSSR